MWQGGFLLCLHKLHGLHLFVAEAMKRIEEIKAKRQNQFITNRFVFVELLRVRALLMCSMDRNVCISVHFV